MLATWLFWNPHPTAFFIRFLNVQVAWYGLCWAVGFFIALLAAREILFRFLSFHPLFTKSDVLKEGKVREKLHQKFGLEGDEEYLLMNSLLDGERFSLPSRFFNKLLLSFAKPKLTPKEFQLVKNRLFLDEYFRPYVISLREKAFRFAELGWAFVALGTVVGARVGHIVFYHSSSEYLSNPLLFFKIWEGGLASHGAVAGILLSLFVFLRIAKKEHPYFSFFRWTDIGVVPILIGCAFIRIGNFCNQELLGTVTNVPWAIIFGNPMDGSIPEPRHPVQLYEALLYFTLIPVIYVFLFSKSLRKTGVPTGILLTAVFCFRFLVEFVKEPQGYYDQLMSMHMGQLLSIPCVMLGMYLMFRKGRKQVWAG